MKKIYSGLLLFISISAHSQIIIDKSISLSGSGSDAKISGIEEVLAADDAMNVSSLQSGSFLYGGTAGGTGSAYTLALTPAISGYTAGMVLYFKANVPNNAGSVTINVNGQGTQNILKNGGASLAAGDIAANQLVCLIHDGTGFNLLSLSSGVAAGSNNYIQNITPDNALATGQAANSDITGSSEIGGTLKVSGNVGIGTVNTADRMDILTDANSGLGVRLYGDQNKERFVIETSTSPVFQTGHYRGTHASKTATQSGDALGFFQSGGYDGSVQRFNEARMVAFASENHSATNQGARLEFQTTPNGSTFASIATRMTIDQTGNVNIGNNIMNNAIRLEVRTTTPGHGAYIRTDATTGTNYGIDGEAMGVGATTNIGGYFAASGATNNYAIIVPPGFGNVGIGYTAPASKLTVGGVIESVTGGYKFPDGTTQTTALAVANFLGYQTPASVSAIIAANSGYAQFTAAQNTDATVFEVISSPSPYGIRIKKAGTIMWNFDQDIITAGTSGYSYIYTAIDGTIRTESLLTATNSQWDGLHTGGSYAVTANQVITFQFGSSSDITAMDHSLWSHLSIVWFGAK